MIEIEFEDLPVVTDPVTVMCSDVLLIHLELGDSNICVHHKIHPGDVAEGFAQADVLIESEHQLLAQEHTHLQLEAGLAYIGKEGRGMGQRGGHWSYTDRAQIAHVLGLPEEQVRVIYPSIGGTFSEREDMSVQIEVQE